MPNKIVDLRELPAPAPLSQLNMFKDMFRSDVFLAAEYDAQSDPQYIKLVDRLDVYSDGTRSHREFDPGTSVMIFTTSAGTKLLAAVSCSDPEFVEAIDKALDGNFLTIETWLSIYTDMPGCRAFQQKTFVTLPTKFIQVFLVDAERYCKTEAVSGNDIIAEERVSWEDFLKDKNDKTVR